MDTEELENQMQMNDYFPLLAENIKQELFDTTEKNNLCDSVENKVCWETIKSSVIQGHFTNNSKISRTGPVFKIFHCPLRLFL